MDTNTTTTTTTTTTTVTVTVTVNWASLPNLVLLLIAKRLPTRIDLLCFRAVCRSFLRSVPSPPKPISPLTGLKLPLPPCRPNPNLNTKFMLTQSTVYAIQPLTKISNTYKTTKTWVVRVKESISEKVQVLDPFLMFPFKNLSEKLPKSLSLLDYRVTELTKVFGLVLVDTEKGNELGGVQCPFFKKVVVSSSLDDIKDGFTVMGIYTGGKLGVWRKGDEEWTTINFGSDRIFFEDVVYHNDKFYALTTMGHAITVDSKSLKVSQVSASMGDWNYKYLVPSCEELFLIDKHFLDDSIQFGFEEGSDERSYPVSLNVFKLDEENHVWFPVMNDLEDRVLFCNSDCSFSISAKEFAGCKKNCVYFTDDSFDEGRDDHPGWNAGIYDLEDDTVGALSDFPEYSKIFWPPPVWLKPTK